MIRFGYLLTLMLIFVLSTATLTSCSKKSGCPTMGQKANKKEIKRGGKSNLFDKKTRRRLGFQNPNQPFNLETILQEQEWCDEVAVYGE